MKNKYGFACVIGLVIFLSVSCVSTPDKPLAIHAPANPPAGVTAINDNTTGSGLGQFEYSAGWTYAPGGGAKYKEDDHVSGKAGEYYKVRFVGTSIKVYSTKDDRYGSASVIVDDWQAVTVSYNALPRDFQMLVFDSGPIDPGEHVLKVIAVGDGVISADRVDVTK